MAELRWGGVQDEPGVPQTLQAARVTTLLLDYKEILDRVCAWYHIWPLDSRLTDSCSQEELPVEFIHRGKTPLSMVQFQRLFTTYREPGESCDTLRVIKPQDHIVVIRRKQHYVVPVYETQRDGSKRRLCSREIEAMLHQIDGDSQRCEPALGVGLLTAEERPTWHRLRNELLQASDTNKASLAAIENSLFVLVLDKTNPKAEIDEFYHNTLAGDANDRWFDKAFNIIVYEDGEVGINAEHSPSEATVPNTICEHVLTALRGIGRQDYPDAAALIPRGRSLPPPQRLHFDIPETVASALQVAERNYAKLRDNLVVSILHYFGYGTDWIKKNRLGPDSFVQMALQLAYYRLHNTFVATYETGQTRQFNNGRTDTVRPCSVESAEFCRVMLDPAASDKQRAAAFGAALKTHSAYMAEVVAGNGFDRHLMGLRIIAAENGIEMPAIFTDPVYKRATTFKLSTSNVPTRGIVNGGFGPVVPDGYGVCYQLYPKLLTINMYAVHAFVHSLVRVQLTRCCIVVRPTRTRTRPM